MQLHLTGREFEALMAPFLLRTEIDLAAGIVVAVSGGADSMALALLLHHYTCMHEIPFYAVTVDHGLRNESSTEAAWVHESLVSHGIAHTTLTWQHAGGMPKTKIQESARHARYQLIGDFCKRNGVSVLLTGHHLDDQLETFFMRLAHRSGLKGLCGMRSVAHTDFGCIIRPMLSVSKVRLQQTLVHAKIDWCDDPSNSNRKFERIRVRQFLTEGQRQSVFDPESVAQSINKLSDADGFIEACVDDFFNEAHANCVDEMPSYNFFLADFQRQHSYLKERIIFRIISSFRLQSYVPGTQSIAYLCCQLDDVNFQGATLGGLHFKRSKGGVVNVVVERR